jgi:hypothetical protein
MSDYVRRSLITLFALGAMISSVMAVAPDVLWSAVARLM